MKECKKESIKASEKRKNDRVSQIINDFKRHDKRINQLNTKHCNSTNISTLKRLRNKTEEYMNKARKYRDEVLRIVNISNLSNKICINASTQVDIDFDSTKSEVVSDNDSKRDATVNINDDFDDDDSKYLQNVDTNDDSDDDNINDDLNVNTNVNINDIDNDSNVDANVNINDDINYLQNVDSNDDDLNVNINNDDDYFDSDDSDSDYDNSITLDLERVISMNRLNRKVTHFIVKTIRN